jgi:hypothetical protein
LGALRLVPFKLRFQAPAAAALTGLWLLVGSPALAEFRHRAGEAGPALSFPPSEQGVSEAYIVSFGLYGGESVFESEARGAAQVLSAHFGKSHALVRFNTKRGGAATREALAAALKAAGTAMDPDEDLLVVALTSHGNRKGLAITRGAEENLLSPRQLEKMLAGSRAKYRVMIVSACYSGVFARRLASPRTLVITAAAADRPSFGCEDGATWTYFGEAFYARALAHHRRLDAAFTEAKRLVTARERREGQQPSNPQFVGGAEVLAILAR